MTTQFQLKAVEQARSPERPPYGMCLVHVLQSEGTIWQQLDTLVPKNFQQPGNAQPKGRGRQNIFNTPGRQPRPGQAQRAAQQSKGGKGGGPGGKAPFKPSVQSSPKKSFAKVKTATEIGGKQVCKAFNDQRGCKFGSSCKFANICDVLVNGKGCGRSDHNRLSHDPQRHGAPDKR